jgi:murein DD-endopeptidase MepM/ murein hydrolase activator NlpD
VRDHDALLLLLLLWLWKRRDQQQANQPTPLSSAVKDSFRDRLKLQTFPVPGSTSYADTFGHPWGPGKTHEGVDIFAPEGTAVFAVADGVVRTQEGPVGGKMVTLTLPDGTWFLYSHLRDFAKLVPGGKVKAGALLGYVGDTGNALRKGAHVHFEAHPKGGPAVDPYPALRAASVNGADATSPPG